MPWVPSEFLNTTDLYARRLISFTALHIPCRHRIKPLCPLGALHESGRKIPIVRWSMTASSEAKLSYTQNKNNFALGVSMASPHSYKMNVCARVTTLRVHYLCLLYEEYGRIALPKKWSVLLYWPCSDIWCSWRLRTVNSKRAFTAY